MKYGPKIVEWLDQCGMSETRLKMKLLSLLEANETVFQKLKGRVKQKDLPSGYRVVATSDVTIPTEGGDITTDGDTLIEVRVQALETRRRSLDMAFKFRGLYAAEKVEHSGSVATKLEMNEQDRALLRKGIDASINKLMEGKHAKPA
jgi:hypothetical protein